MIIIGNIVVLLFLLLSIILSVVGFSGSLVAFFTALIYAWATGFQIITWKTLLILLGMACLAEIVEITSGTIGAKRFQASREAVWGSMIGLIIGFFLSIVTFQFYLIPLGLVIGVVAGEYLAGRTEPRIIARSLVGVLVGKIGGIIFKSILTLTMAIIITFQIFHG